MTDLDKLIFESFIQKVQKAWGPISTETVAACHRLMEELASKPSIAKHLAKLLKGDVSAVELHRDAERGFVLLAYTETQGQYRIPHDHGNAWVAYAVQQGEMEMGTYVRIVDQSGKLRLVRREIYRMRPGECKVFLPGDIHHTRCLSESVTLLRLTSNDLKKEELEGRMIRYAE